MLAPGLLTTLVPMLSRSSRPLLRCSWVALALGACATGSPGSGGGPDAGSGVDAGPTIDGGGEPDATACVVGPVELLTNPAFDDAPVGTGWTEDAFDVVIIQAPPDGATAHSGATVAWMAGYATTSDDHLSQDVVVPASATALEISGYVWVETEETGAADFDVAQLRLTTVGGAVVEAVGAWSNQTEGGAWQPFSFAAASPHAGETLRLQFDASTDGSLLTSFLFDSMSVSVQACQP